MGFELPSRQPRALAADCVTGKGHEDVLHEDVLHELDPDLVLELQPELGHLESEAEPKLATRAEQNVDPGPEIPD